MMVDTVETRISTRWLCHSCGTCAGCCPSDAIEMKRTYGAYVPVVNISKCNECHVCIEVCPAIADFDALSNFVFGQIPDEISIGDYINCYVGYSTNPQLRWNSASGGLVTTLLIFALNNGIIDGAITTRMSERKPLEPEVTIAQSEVEIIESSKSKYCPVCVNAEIKGVFSRKGKYAIVGLPCQIQGVRKAESVFKELDARIYLHMGLFCLHNITFAGTDLLLEKFGIQKVDVKRLDYRGEGWPGKISVTLKTGHKKSYSYRPIWSALFGSFFFTPLSCMHCHDMTSELADISFGDAWLPELMDEKEGVSMVIARTERGENILRRAEEEGKIKLQKISKQKLLEAHKLGIYFKKRNLAARIKLLNFLGFENVDCSGLRLLHPKIADYLVAPLPYFNIWVSSNRHLLKLLQYAPISLLKSYTFLFNQIRKLAT